MKHLQIGRHIIAILSIGAFASFAGQQTAKDACVHHGTKDTCVHHPSNHPCVDHDTKSTCDHHSGSNSQGVNGTSETKTVVPKTPDKQILFFMNPNGHPCQMQLSIIDNMKAKLNGLATVTYIKTTEPSDENKFYQFGIRGLPSLIIADKNGKEIKRLPPGIKDENAILAALDN